LLIDEKEFCLMDQSQIKILAIDEDPVNLALLKALIKDSFPKAITITTISGKEGLELALAEDPDIIVLNLVMPVLDGFTVCKKLKSDRRTNDIPVVFIAAQKGDKESRLKAMEVGADAFLAKPVDENELTAQIRAMVKIKHANIEKRNEKEKLALMVEEKTMEQRNTYVATLNLLEDLARENNARKKNEEALKKSEESLADIFQTVKEGIAYTTLSGEILSINNSLEKILGVKAERIVGKTITQLIKEFLSQQNINILMPVLDKIKKRINIEGFKVDLNDKILEISVTINYESNRMTAVIRDITERKKAEEILRKSEEKFRSLVENAFDGIYLSNGKYFYFVNDKFCEITGYSAVELTSPDFNLEIALTDDSVKILNERTFLRQPEMDVAGTYELQFKTKEGNYKFVEISTVKIGSGNEMNIMGIVRDITERRRIETQIIQSERLSALGEMSAGMAHEINQPLNTLSILFDNILLEARTNHSVNEDYLVHKSEKIFNNILRIRNLIDHVRDFSRSHDGYILNLFDINQSILNALSMVSEQFRIADIKIITLLDENLPQVKGNTYKFEQVILNFISNSKDALMEKKARLGKSFPMYIKVISRFDRNNIYLDYEDNGIGIPEEDIDKVLQPFYTTKEPGKGTGLGLSISYGLIREMDGAISVQSKVLSGTIITVTIPVKN
jgi:PAS domain S-box-containing protein